MKVNHFINLTNGLQAIKDYSLTDYKVIRLQSTACEQKRWGFILDSISDELLLRLALGELCTIYDYGAGKDTPRSMWQGVEWLKFALGINWFNSIYTLQGRVSKSGGSYFGKEYLLLPSTTKSRLKYFKKFLQTDTLHLSVITSSTDKDGDYEYYNNLFKG